MGAPSSTGRTPSWSNHWSSNQCAALGTHGCTCPWDGHQHGAMGAPAHDWPLAPMGAPSSMGRTQLVMLIPFLAPMGAPSSMGWTPSWSHHWCSNQCSAFGTHGCTYPWDGHQHGAMGAPAHARLLAPMGAPSSMGQTQQWTHRCSNQCLALGTHGCSLFHGMDPTMDPLISTPHF